MIGNGGHAKTIRLECGSANIVAIGDNRKRKQVVLEEEAKPGFTEWALMLLPRRLPIHFYEVQPFSFGSVMLPGAVIGAGARIGAHCIINHNAVVDHDVILEDFVHVAPGAKMLGGSKACEGAFIGANAVVLPGAVVPAWAIVRAGSVFPADYVLGDGYKGSKRGRLTLKYQPEL